MTSKHIAVGLAFLIILASAFGLGWRLSDRQHLSNVAEPKVVRGTITTLSDGCRSGGTCSITVGDTIIVTSCAVLPDSPSCDDYDHTKLRIGGEIEAIVVKADAGNYYNLDCDTCTIQTGD